MTAKRQTAKAARQVRSVAARASRLVPRNGDVDELVSAISAERARPIRVMAEDLHPSGPFGVWFPTAKNDWIIIPKGIGAAARTATICHELAHMLLGHEPRPLMSFADLDELVARIAPEIDPEIAKRILLARSLYDDDLEIDAEVLATVLVTKLAQSADRHRLTDDVVSERLR